MTFPDLLRNFSENASSTSEKGLSFERFVKKYLESAHLYKKRFDKIWLWKDFPYSITARDTGIDLVARERISGGFVAIQCKFFDINTPVYKKDIDSFISDSGKSFEVDGQKVFYSYRIIITTSSKWGANVNAAIRDQSIPVQLYNFNNFVKLEDIDWSSFTSDNIDSLKVSHKPKTLRPHQTDAIEAILKAFVAEDRGKLIMACGTGKTFTSLKLAERYCGAGKTVLFLAPSISLISQTIEEWLREASLKIGCIPVCSDVKVGKHEAGEDRMEMSLSELIFPASTDDKTFVRNYECLPADAMKVVFSTYQSIEVVRKGQDRCGFEFDLIICDEAHRTTGVTLSGTDESSFVKIHDNSFIKGKKRLYMTATPRVYGESVKDKARDNDAFLCSMDDENLFGRELYRLGFGEAVDKGLLSDYKVVILTVSDRYVHYNFQKYMAAGDDLNDFAKIAGCWDALSKRNADFESDPEPMKRAVAFAGTIKASKYFVDQITLLQNEYDYESAGLIPLSAEHVDGKMNSLERNEKLNNLKRASSDNACKILSNARCLSEGVDVPSLDAVLFLSPKNSMVDIVQSVGRVMRKSEDKKYGYIVLPVMVPSNVSPEQALKDNNKYKIIWDVLQALRSHDDRFNHIINTLEFNRSMNKYVLCTCMDTDQEGDTLSYTPIDLDLDIDYHDWVDAIYSRIIQKCGDRYYWDSWSKDVAEIAKNHIATINEILSTNKEARLAFDNFHDVLRKNLNNEIKAENAVEMISQHLITKPVFDALFSGYSFVKSNPVSVAMQEIVNALDDGRLTGGIRKLDRFYESVRVRTDGIDTVEAKQKIIIELYDKFFRLAFKDVTEKLGIVYTPVEPVDFIIRSVDYVLKEKFNLSLSDQGVHIIDPFTGTGTFIVRLLQSGLISRKNLDYKYKNEIHANEIILLAYYIAAINIEEAYHALSGKDEYTPFEGVVLTDTFNLEERNTVEVYTNSFLKENSSRLNRQQACSIKVIIGNPPYSAGQKSANDNNQNTRYPRLEKSIADTYAKYSTATRKASLYDSYIKAFRWASNRIEGEGVVCFITNGGYIDSQSMNGFRKCISEEFSDIYCFNLRGDQRTQGELSKKEGGKIFGSGSRASIAITLLIKDPKHKGPANIFYYDIGDYLTREQKLDIIKNIRIETMNWTRIVPDKNNDWINKRSDSFSTFVILDSKRDKNNRRIFLVSTLGINTSRDTWSYNFNKNCLKSNIISFINTYNIELERYISKSISENEINTDKKKIKWSGGLIENFKKKRSLIYFPKEIRTSLYRPFCKQFLYYDKALIERTYQMPKVFPTDKHENLLICVNGIGGKRSFMPLIANVPVCLDFIEKSQCFPMFYYIKYDSDNPLENSNTDADEYGYVKEYAISDFYLEECRKRYGETVTKEDIFYYVYGLLHSKEYASKYSNDLKKSLPRIPYVKSAKDFDAFNVSGRMLADLHLNYETLEPYPVFETVKPNPSYKVKKMKFDKKNKSVIIYNESVTFSGIPEKTYDYVVNGRSPLEWAMENYLVKTDKDSGIKNDPNDYSSDEKYIYNLVKRLITLSLETLKIIKSLPRLDIEL